MNQPKEVHIWNPETGIVPLSAEAAATIAPSETKSIIAGLAEENARLKDTKQLQEFNDRLRREWSVETGLIEGIFILDRGTTTTLIEKGFDPRYIGHGTSDRPAAAIVQVLIDHKSVLDGLFDLIKGDRSLTTSYIKELHSQLTRSQHETPAVDSLGKSVQIPLLRGEWKTSPNSPMRVGSLYHYCPPEQTASEMDNLIKCYETLCNSETDPIVVAAWLHHRFTQIHPFQDGNGRVVRAIVTLILIRAGLTPFTITSESRGAYIDTLEAADRDPTARGLKPLVEIIRKRCVQDFSTMRKIALEVEIEGTISDEQSETTANLISMCDLLARESKKIVHIIYNNFFMQFEIHNIHHMHHFVPIYEKLQNFSSPGDSAITIEHPTGSENVQKRAFTIEFSNYPVMTISVVKQGLKYRLIALSNNRNYQFGKMFEFDGWEAIEDILERYSIWFQNCCKIQFQDIIRTKKKSS